MPAITTDIVLQSLSRHIGAAQGVRVDELVAEITGKTSTPHDERDLRQAVVKLRDAGYNVCASPASNYNLAATDAELDATCTFLFERAMTTQQQNTTKKHNTQPDQHRQLHL